MFSFKYVSVMLNKNFITWRYQWYLLWIDFLYSICFNTNLILNIFPWILTSKPFVGEIFFSLLLTHVPWEFFVLSAALSLQSAYGNCYPRCGCWAVSQQLAFSTHVSVERMFLVCGCVRMRIFQGGFFLTKSDVLKTPLYCRVSGIDYHLNEGSNSNQTCFRISEFLNYM